MEGEGRDRACGDKTATIEAGGRAGARRALRVREVPDGARLRVRIPPGARSILAMTIHPRVLRASGPKRGAVLAANSSPMDSFPGSRPRVP